MKKKYEKKIYVKAVVILLVGIVGAIALQQVPAFFSRNSPNNLKFIEYEQIEDMLTDSQDYFLVISKDKCPYCVDLKEVLVDIEVGKKYENFYIYEYAQAKAESIVPKLDLLFPKFVLVPYICYISDGNIERYTGQIVDAEILEWVESVSINN